MKENSSIPREEQKEQRRREILIAGLDLFILKGYEGTKIADIAERVGMSNGLIYRYFSSTEALYEALVVQGLEGTKMPLKMKFDEPLEFFKNFTDLLLQSLKTQPYIPKMFLLMAQAQRSVDTPPHIRQIAMQVNTIEQTVPLIRKGQKNGTIRKGDPLALATAFWCSIQGIMEQAACVEDTPIPETGWIIDILRSHKDE
jgi:AcrR family transcriptional regulator